MGENEQLPPEPDFAGDADGSPDSEFFDRFPIESLRHGSVDLAEAA